MAARPSAERSVAPCTRQAAQPEPPGLPSPQSIERSRLVGSRLTSSTVAPTPSTPLNFAAHFHQHRCRLRQRACRAPTPSTATISIVFSVSEDPVKFGLVTSLARPSGNLTGVNLMGLELTAKRLELLREMLPGAARVAVLVNPAQAANTQITLHEVEAAGRAMVGDCPR